MGSRGQDVICPSLCLRHSQWKAFYVNYKIIKHFKLAATLYHCKMSWHTLYSIMLSSIKFGSTTAVISPKNTKKKQKSSSENVQFWISEAFFHLHFSVRGYFPVPHVNVTARSSAQFNVLLFRRASVNHFLLQTKPWIIIISRKTRAWCWNDSDLNRIWFKVTYIMQFIFQYCRTVMSYYEYVLILLCGWG